LISLVNAVWRTYASPWRISSTVDADEAAKATGRARGKYITDAVDSLRRLAERGTLFTFRLP
jgi:hypothetical protein